jgi:hypothetical protein
MFNWFKNLISKNKPEKVEQKVFSVDTGNLPIEKAKDFVNKIKVEKQIKDKTSAPKRRGRPKKND